MDHATRTEILDLLQGLQLAEAHERLRTVTAEEHPLAKRLDQLGRHLRQLEDRRSMGTLSPADLERGQRRIAGGLREIILDHAKAPAVRPSPEPAPAPAINLDLRPNADPTGKESEPVFQPLGFLGEVTYQGSPSKKSETLVLAKSYGATYHAAVQAVRKCGMTMESGDREGGRIHATTTGNTVARFGENIYLWITGLGRARTRVHVIVDSANPDTVFDLGRHQQKLSALLHQLRNA